MRVPALMLRGVVRSRLGMFDDALADFTEAIILDRDNPDCYTLRGLLNRRMQRLSTAVVDVNFVVCLSG